MKKRFIMFFIITIIITITLTISVYAKPVVSAPAGFYPHMAQVTNVTKVKRGKYKGCQKVTSIDGARRTWKWYDDSEFWVKDDFVAFIMYDNGTKNVYDDVIVDARYVGYRALFK